MAGALRTVVGLGFLGLGLITRGIYYLLKGAGRLARKLKREER